ncbi:hypothetical protein D3C78_184530 [compost metagenome]
MIPLNEYEKASTGCRGFFHVRDEYHPKIKTVSSMNKQRVAIKILDTINHFKPSTLSWHEQDTMLILLTK